MLHCFCLGILITTRMSRFKAVREVDKYKRLCVSQFMSRHSSGTTTSSFPRLSRRKLAHSLILPRHNHFTHFQFIHSIQPLAVSYQPVKMRMQSAVVILSLCAGSLGAPIFTTEERIVDNQIIEKREPQIISPAAAPAPPTINVNAPQAAPAGFAAPFGAPFFADRKPKVVSINQATEQAPVAAPLAAAPIAAVASRPQSQTVTQPA